jgi:FtsP/CotA-like multicopper oxidase with cupredoxin domain
MDGMGGMMGDSGSGGLARFTVNGKAYPHTVPLVVRQGERVRLRLINARLTATQVLALAGHQLMLTHTDGNPLRLAVPVDAVALGVGERADVEFLALQPRRWQLGADSAAERDRGLGIDVVYEGHEADPVQGIAPDRPRVTTYSDMIGGPYRKHGRTAPSGSFSRGA